MFRFSLLFACSAVLWWAVPAGAQDLQDLSNCKTYNLLSSEAERLEDVAKFYGSPDAAVRLECDELQFSADYIEIFKKTDMLAARGHVVFVSGGNRIAADRAEFNTRTRTGTFYNAFGSASLGERADRSMFGTQEPDMYFRGEEISKIGPKKYRITRGGFTTCVQPTPRWEISSGTVTLNLDEYALLSGSVFRVKGVPLFYLPVFYYPIQEDDRATGFLIPTYGTSTSRGQTISNAFFWAISRSQDATVYHDWMSKAAQQVGSEYRYVASAGSQGNARFALLNESAATLTLPDGTSRSRDPRRSYSLGGDMVQALPGTFRLRANADYFSSIVTQQQYQQNLTQATRRDRRFAAHVSGTLGQFQISAVTDRNDYFYSATELTTNGSLPRVSVSRPERPLGGTPLYFGVNGEYVNLLRSTSRDDEKIQDQGLTRFDVQPTLRFPFSRWPFLTMTTALSWRGTYWTESLNTAGQQVDEKVARQYFDMSARFVGPVFSRVFNPPEGSDGLRFKHVIEPTFTIARTSAIDELSRIVRLDVVDTIVGSVTSYRYGLTNRLYAKKDVPREVLTVSINQSAYTRAEASQFDPNYQSSFTTRSQSNFSPVQLVARVSPTERLQGEFRAEFDARVKALRTVSANGTYSEGGWIDVTAGWSQRRFIRELRGFDDPRFADQYITTAVNLRGFRNRLGGRYEFHYDLLNDRYLNQRYVAYYNAQCCGVGFEYQTYNLQGSFVTTGLPQDRRFNISFTLAGIGTFSNLFGAFGGQQDRR